MTHIKIKKLRITFLVQQLQARQKWNQLKIGNRDTLAVPKGYGIADPRNVGL